MQTTLRKILVPHGAITKMARLEGVGRETVREALAGFTRSELAMRLRAVAVTEYGGVEVRDSSDAPPP